MTGFYSLLYGREGKNKIPPCLANRPGGGLEGMGRPGGGDQQDQAL
jgi:hypothetical protein